MLLIVIDPQGLKTQRVDHEHDYEHEEENKEGSPCEPPSVFRTATFSLGFAALRNYFVQLEDRQKHRDHDPAHDHAEKNNQHRFDE